MYHGICIMEYFARKWITNQHLDLHKCPDQILQQPALAPMSENGKHPTSHVGWLRAEQDVQS